MVEFIDFHQYRLAQAPYIIKGTPENVMNFITASWAGCFLTDGRL